MKFSFVAVSLFAINGVFAMPAIEAEHVQDLAAGKKPKCGFTAWIKCATAAAPTIAVCGAAAAEEGFNPWADAACLARLASLTENVPAACKSCI